MYFNLKLNNLICTGIFLFKVEIVTSYGDCDTIFVFVFSKDQIIIELQTRTCVKNILEISGIISQHRPWN